MGRQKQVPKRDLYALLRDHASDDEKLGELWNEVNTVPHWVDWDQIGVKTCSIVMEELL
jgi:hypothetical protein